MKNILTIIGLLITSVALASPFSCVQTMNQCKDVSRNLTEEQKNSHYCFVQPQSFCDDLLVQHEATEKQKYETREGKAAPEDFVVSASSSEPVLGSQAGTIKVLPVIGGFSILGALIAGLFIFFRK